MVGKVQFPSQIVEMLGVAILLVLILISIKREKSFYYQYCICFAILIFASEFGIEETKVNVIVTAPITGVQLGALILLFISVLYMFLERKLGDCSHKR